MSQNAMTLSPQPLPAPPPVIAEGLTEACPGCDIAGTSMYMEIAR